MSRTVLGVIGGSGVYQIDGLQNARWQRVKSPWGEPSDEVLMGMLGGIDMVFLPRHGRGTFIRRRPSTTAPTSTR